MSKFVELTDYDAAPHGGIFVFPVVGNAVMYLVSLVVGTVISAVLLGLLKKKVA